MPVLPYRLQSLHYNNVAVLMSWLLFAYSAGIFFCTFPVAFFFHRYPYRRGPLVIATLVMEASFVLFMLAPPYWAMVISRFIQGGCSCVIWTGKSTLLLVSLTRSWLCSHLREYQPSQSRYPSRIRLFWTVYRSHYRAANRWSSVQAPRVAFAIHLHDHYQWWGHARAVDCPG